MPTTKKTETSAPVSTFTPKVKRMITLPLIKAPLNTPVYIKITDPIFIGKQIGDKDAAIIANCVNLETGEQGQFLVPAVMQGVLHDEYGAPHYGVEKKGEPVKILKERLDNVDSDAYVGRGFMVTKLPKISGKNYHPHTIAEIEV